MLGDDALVYSHRLSEWCSRAPDLEEDIALANIALDLLGQARLLLARAAAADPAVVPALPEGSPVPPEDALAFFREAGEFRNVRLVEPDNGDFAMTIVRLLVFSTWRLAIMQRLVASVDTGAVGHRGQGRQGAHLPPRLRRPLVPHPGPGHRRVAAAAARRARRRVAVTAASSTSSTRSSARPSTRASASTRAAVADEVDVVLEQVLSVSGVERPDQPALAAVRGRTGRDGLHTEALSRMLAEMQVVARAHPMGQW